MAPYAELMLYLSSCSEDQTRITFWYKHAEDENWVDLGRVQVSAGGPVWEALLQAGKQSPFDDKIYGRLLTDWFFANADARQAFASAYQEAHGPLRVRLHFDPLSPVEMQYIRWETMLPPLSFPRDTIPIGFREDFLLSRYAASRSLQRFSAAERERPAALVAIASPEGYESQYPTRIDMETELELARRGMPHVELRVLANGRANLKNIINEMRQHIDFFYLVAHGGWNAKAKRMVILLDGPNGKGSTIPVEDFIDQIKDPLPLLAVLISCQSAVDTPSGESVSLPLGPALVKRGIPAVLAMQGNASVEMMREFLPAFFYHLACSGLIDQAVTEGRRAARGQPGWWMPVVYSHLHDNQLLQPSEFAHPRGVKPFEPETVYIPGGTFWMGRDSGSDIPSEETPRHAVDLPAYRIGAAPVTNEQYYVFVRDMRDRGTQNTGLVNPEMGWRGLVPIEEQLQAPVAGVSWFQAMRYCAWLRAKTKRYYTLPNEAQWEKAARGWENTLFPWGDEWAEGRCNASLHCLQPVRAYPPQSCYGCYDLVGNVPEWTVSLWGENYNIPDPPYRYPWKSDNKRQGPDPDPHIRRILRGGVSPSHSQMTCTARRSSLPDFLGPPAGRYGFRVVWVNEPVED